MFACKAELAARVLFHQKTNLSEIAFLSSPSRPVDHLSNLIRSKFFSFLFGLAILSGFSASVFAQSGDFKGLTLITSHAETTPGLFKATCATDIDATCNPYRGDTPCSHTLATLCLRDLDAPVPKTLKRDAHWTGALLSLGPLIRGDSVATIADADAVCAKTFGDGWRLARFRDGGGETLIGFGALPQKQQSVWVDIKDHPRATCWTR